ncbi:MAG: hypothetical protein AB1578_22800 [Thermodesulfobacteriota bacterium]
MSLDLRLTQYPRRVLAEFIQRRCLCTHHTFVELEWMRRDAEVAHWHAKASALVDELKAAVGKDPRGFLELSDQIDHAWAEADRAHARCERRVRAIREHFRVKEHEE